MFSTIWDYPGRTAAATLTSTLSSSLINEFTFSWGSTKPAKFFGQRNCDYCPGGTDAQFVGRTTQVWDADVVNETTGRTMAVFRCTQMVLWPR